MIRPLGAIRDHYWRVVGMASRIGVNLVSAREQGQLSSAEWAEMVRTCRGCEWAAKCDSWMERTDDAPCAPMTCLNRREFEILRRREAG